MPIYEYKCDECGEVSEILVRNTQNQGIVECANCNSANVSRMISTLGAVMAKGCNSVSEMPPMNCPNQGCCGEAGTCPASGF